MTQALAIPLLDPFALPVSTVAPSNLFSTWYSINCFACKGYFVSLCFAFWMAPYCLKNNVESPGCGTTCLSHQPCHALCPSIGTCFQIVPGCYLFLEISLAGPLLMNAFALLIYQKNAARFNPNSTSPKKPSWQPPARKSDLFSFLCPLVPSWVRLARLQAPWGQTVSKSSFYLACWMSGKMSTSREAIFSFIASWMLRVWRATLPLPKVG